MLTLYHAPLCPHSRFIRLALAEYQLETRFIEEMPFERRHDFLILNPSGEVPVLIDSSVTESQESPVIAGAWAIFEYVEETYGAQMGLKRLMPERPVDKAEVRRLLDWFHIKFFREVSHWILREKIEKYLKTPEQGGGPPEMELIRIARHNLHYHLHYIGWLINRRKWLAGSSLSYADLAAAAHISCLDFLGDIPWSENGTAKDWYARVKSRPAFRSLLADRIRGHTPPTTYADLDF